MEILITLKIIYPGALQGDQILRGLLALFPTLEFEQIKRDLHYLCEKGYLARVLADSEEDIATTPWRRRWFRLTTRGVELTDQCLHDPALEQ